MENEKFDFESEYDKLKHKHNLPEFEKLAKDFDIEKITDKEPIFPTREIRRVVNEKITAYLHLFETLINPNIPPIFIFSILRNISTNDKDNIREIYKILSKIQIKAMKLDTIYGEDAEVEFVNETFEIWQKLKPRIYKLIENFELNLEENDTPQNKSYFG